MPNVTRITSNGTFYTANTIDEISYNPSVAFGKNLIRSSQAYNTGFWVPQNSTAIDNFILGPDEKTFASKIIGNAGVTIRKSIYQGITLQANVKYTFSVYVKEAGFSNIMLWFDSTPPGYLEEGAYYGAADLINIIDGTKTGGNQTNPVINVGNGWYRVSVSATPRWALTVGFNLSLGEANGTGTKVGDGFSGVYLWNPQVEIGAVATDPVLTNSSGFPVSNVIFKTTNIGNYYARSYIDEMSYNKNVPAKNLAYPANLALWSKGWDFDPPVINVTDETAAPDGTNTAVKWQQARQSGQLSTPFNNPRYKSGVPYTFSVYAKPGSPSMSFYILLYGFAYAGRSSVNVGVQFFLTPTSTTISDGSGGTADSYGIVPVGNGWYRCWMTSTNRVANNNQGHQFIRYATSDTFAYFWGYQIEEGTVPTDYVQTTNTGTIATNFVKRDTANGVSLVSSQFDEKNGVLDQVIDSSLVINLDAAKLESYPGSGTTWFDTTPNRNDMTIYNFGTANSPIVWDYSSQSFLALGNNFGTSIQGIANATINTPSFSIEIWSRVRSFNAGDFNNNMISGRGNYLQHGHRMGYNPAGGSAAATTGTVGFYSVFNGGTISLTSSTISINTWYQTVITFDDTRKFASFYVNGVLVASQRDAVYTMPQQPAWTSGPSAFTNGQGTASINGNIGNFMYYNRPLVASEVSQNYSAIRGRYGI